jgi:predicted HicB family RNase H-like nuclease
MHDMKPWALRVPDDLARRVDDRAKMVGMSRNEWVTRALEWAVSQPVRTETVKRKV